MKKSWLTKIGVIVVFAAFTSCEISDDSEPILIDNGGIVVPSFSTPNFYEFTRNGQSTVNYSGQTERMNQLAEIKIELLKADDGIPISAQDLKDMFENTNGNANGNFSFISSKQLKNKTFTQDHTYFEQLFDSVAHYSITSNQTVASNGVAGLSTRSGNKTILVNKNGQEFTQLIEKGLMGATFYQQIVNTYLTDDKIGDAVDNSIIDSNYNATKMEHHFDEAFGYLGAPFDFSSNYNGNGTVSYWANYSNTVDPVIQMNDRIMNAFKRARAAIVAQNYLIRDEEVEKIYTELEVLIAATAIHYANEAKAATVDGDRLHVLSECYAFIKAFRYSNAIKRRLTQMEVETLLGYIGTNFWNTTETNLNLLINKLATTYGLESVKSQL